MKINWVRVADELGEFAWTLVKVIVVFFVGVYASAYAMSTVMIEKLPEACALIQ